MGLTGLDPPPPLLVQLRSFDEIVSWYGSNREEFRAQMSQLGVPVPFQDALPPAGGKIHAADFFLQQAGCSGMAVPRILNLLPAPAGDFAGIPPVSGVAPKNSPL